ncbi:hypothetical protein PIB30_033624 [Stylosanthes scabra]|uniref:Uncharacterized protein n=1 Tax=Stylosanthes scabra TaxID=79078 RepID=A0ABU6RCP2_9FABA|nr:hypothetical protein [Stylosanthes scabra]
MAAETSLFKKNPRNRACNFHRQHWEVTHLYGTCDYAAEVLRSSERRSSLVDGRDELSKPSSMEVFVCVLKRERERRSGGPGYNVDFGSWVLGRVSGSLPSAFGLFYFEEH